MNSTSISISFKIFLQHGDDNNSTTQVRRISVGKQPNWSGFRSLIFDLFSTEQVSSTSIFTAQYQDEEGDKIVVSSEQEWEEALRVFSAHNISPFKIYINVPKSAAASSCDVNPCSQESWPRKKEFKCKERKLNKIKNRSNDNNIQEETGSNSSQEMKALKKKQKQLLKLKQQINSTPFEDHPLLKVGALIHLQSLASKKNLRILQDGNVDGNGGTGELATFRVHGGLCNKSSIRLQNIANPNYWLKISQDGKLDGKGHGGPWTEFKIKVHKAQEQNSITESCLISLRSLKFEGKAGVGILENGQPKPPSETGLGKFGKFLVLPCAQQQQQTQN